MCEIKDIIRQLHLEEWDEILINGCRAEVRIRDGRSEIYPSRFSSQRKLLDNVQNFVWNAGARLDLSHLSNGGVYDGVRWHALIPPAAFDGTILSLRRQKFEGISLSDFNCDERITETITELIEKKRTLIIHGSTSSGKSSMLVSCLKCLPEHERVIILETLPEIPLLKSSWVRLVEVARNFEGKGRFNMAQLLAETLRLRPDRIVIGELRGSEARVFLDSLATGHGGAMLTIHAESVEDVKVRLSHLSGLDHEDLRMPLKGAVYIKMKRGFPPQINLHVT